MGVSPACSYEDSLDSTLLVCLGSLEVLLEGIAHVALDSLQVEVIPRGAHLDERLDLREG